MDEKLEDFSPNKPEIKPTFTVSKDMLKGLLLICLDTERERKRTMKTTKLETFTVNIQLE